ncbi:MAG: TraB/GumN family protein [Nanoarchaeota archaeon]|nr:TraB/GumN family protein [Nanoarchaeota archaeon]
MYDIGNLTLIGSSHISPKSVKEVREVILEKQPNFVAIELDKGRFLGLMGKQSKLQFSQIRRMGVKGFLFALFGSWLEEKLGKIVKTKPGAEMKSAVITAAKVNAKIALIDQNIDITVKRLFKAITWREKFRFIGDIIKGLISRKPQIDIKFDLREVPSEEIIEQMISLIKDRYPSVYKVLIDERNKYMAKKLQILMKQNPDAKIVVVVGAGHIKGMKEILEH